MRVYFQKGDIIKLFKLLFLTLYVVVYNDCKILGVLDRPRLSLRFKVYLFGVSSSDIYDILESLVVRGLLRLEDVNTYVLNFDSEVLLNML